MPHPSGNSIDKPQNIIGRRSTVNRVQQQIETVAATDATMLILGEAGTGKELIARAVHNLSSRRGHALVRADCACIPAGLLESELSATSGVPSIGTTDRNIGRFELANKGTI